MRYTTAENFAKVYPRVCGGASPMQRASDTGSGLSPRVRGSPRRSPPSCGAEGSIPACAGEPARSHLSGAVPRVYPRVCGGASREGWTAFTGGGLSPRVRGSPQPEQVVPELRGSIPACAGEPSSSYPSAAGTRVYPRVCGGASAAIETLADASGLSPRVRGSPHLTLGSDRLDGSIPACAGEPAQHLRPAPVLGVYPRVCGGAASHIPTTSPPAGLSPRVRGSRDRERWRDGLGGSIPACAGEPRYGSAG